MKWKSALYGRVSTGHEEQQESIKVQEEALLKYAYENNFEVVLRCFDEGYSGTDFNRPGIFKLREYIENGSINLVIVKDLSRIGRNNMLTLLFLDYLSKKNVRLIAVNEGYDTMKDEDELIGIKTWLNERYSRELSKKIKFALDFKKRKGEYLGAFAPYGYKKSVNIKNKLEVDFYAACIVKKIFELYIKGYGFVKIASILNDMAIPNPSKYYRYGRESDGWNWTSIKKILTNPVYTGCLVQHKYTRKSFKDKSMERIPKDEWITVENTHEGIIDKDTFELAQEILNKRKSEVKYRSKGEPHLFSSVLFCHECGSPLYYRKEKGEKGVYRCARYVRYGRSGCVSHTIGEEELKDIVTLDLKNIIMKNINLEEIADHIKSKIGKDDDYEKQVKSLESEIKKAETKEELIYKDKIDGLIDENIYKKILNEIRALKSHIINEKEELQKKALNKYKNENWVYETIQRFINIELEVDKNVLERFIRRIEIDNCGDIVIYYNFIL